VSRHNLPTPERKINLQLQNDRQVEREKFQRGDTMREGTMPSSLCVPFKAILTASPET
jgi:hypothetical protein